MKGEIKREALLPTDQEYKVSLDLASKASQTVFSNFKKPEEALAAILHGRELGLPPMQSLSSIYVVQGRPALKSETMLAILARGGVTWAWNRDGSDGEAAEIQFKRPGFGEVAGRFTREDAERAGLKGQNWQRYPQNMLRARAISNGARMIAPDLLCGISYTPEDLEEIEPAPTVAQAQACGDFPHHYPTHAEQDWTIPSSDGDTEYRVWRQKVRFFCECEGFRYRSHCRHVAEVRLKIVAGLYSAPCEVVEACKKTKARDWTSLPDEHKDRVAGEVENFKMVERVGGNNARAAQDLADEYADVGGFVRTCKCGAIVFTDVAGDSWESDEKIHECEQKISAAEVKVALEKT